MTAFNVVDVGDVIDESVDVFVVIDVVMPVMLEEFWTKVILVSGDVMLVENAGEGVVIVDGVVGMLVPVGEFWTLGVDISVNLFVEKTEGETECIVEVVVDKLVLV